MQRPRDGLFAGTRRSGQQQRLTSRGLTCDGVAQGSHGEAVADERAVDAAPGVVQQVLGDPQTATRPTIRRIQHPKLGEIPIVGMPISFSAMQPGVRRHAPMRGEHTDEVLAEYGYSAREIDDLRAKKAVV